MQIYHQHTLTHSYVQTQTHHTDNLELVWLVICFLYFGTTSLGTEYLKWVAKSMFSNILPLVLYRKHKIKYVARRGLGSSICEKLLSFSFLVSQKWLNRKYYYRNGLPNEFFGFQICIFLKLDQRPDTSKWSYVHFAILSFWRKIRLKTGQIKSAHNLIKLKTKWSKVKIKATNSHFANKKKWTAN